MNVYRRHHGPPGMVRAVGFLPLAIALSLCYGCQSGKNKSSISDLSPQTRNTHLAQQLNREGLELIDKGELKTAEDRFRTSVEADVFYGPAHNNLGLVLLEQGKPYESAWQFTWAAKLMPQSSQPHNNLGLLFEQIGQLDKAIDAYETALQFNSDDLQAMQHLARTMIKANRTEEPKLNELLEKICYRSEEKDWNAWAREQLLRLGQREN